MGKKNSGAPAPAAKAVEVSAVEPVAKPFMAADAAQRTHEARNGNPDISEIEKMIRRASGVGDSCVAVTSITNFQIEELARRGFSVVKDRNWTLINWPDTKATTSV